MEVKRMTQSEDEGKQEYEIETFIAIDFGSSGSGCAYCSKEVDSINGVSLYTKDFGSKEIKYKNPSAILYCEDKPICWGIQAINEYRRQRRIEQKKEQKNKKIEKRHFLIQNFKLFIHSGEDINIRGKIFDVEKVVGDFLKLIRLDIEEELRKQNKIVDDRKLVKYALTLPAIWTDSDKALMRRAALFAGILTPEYDDADHFLLALEPESAALPCLLYKNVEIVQKTKFLVFDAGGGTIDLSLYENISDGKEQFKLKQLKKASGGTAAGNSINQSFLRFFEKEIGKEKWEKLLCMSSYPEFESNLEKFKIGYIMEEIEDDDEFFIPVPISISKYLDSLELSNDFFDSDEGEIIISGEVLKSIYEKTCNECIGYIEEIVKDVPVKYIFMVGGFSSSNILYSSIKKKFESDTLKVIKPSQPSIRVLQGSLWFAKNPTIISSRCSPLTYGVNVTDKFNPKTHKEEHSVIINNVKYSQNVFKRMIMAGEIVETGTKVKIGVRAIKKDFANFEVYSSKNENPVYVTDQDCQKLINVTIPVTRENQKFDVYMIFGETELKFEVLDSENGEKMIHTAIFEFNKFQKKKKTGFSKKPQKPSKVGRTKMNVLKKAKGERKRPPPLPRTENEIKRKICN